MVNENVEDFCGFLEEEDEEGEWWQERGKRKRTMQMSMLFICTMPLYTYIDVNNDARKDDAHPSSPLSLNMRKGGKMDE